MKLLLGRAPVCAILLVIPGLVGCGSFGKLVFGPKEPLLVSTVELTRGRAISQPAERSGSLHQTLRIELPSGRVAFTDSDGRAHPQQLAPALAAQIQHMLTDRSFYAARNMTPAKNVAPMHYHLTVLAANDQHGKSLRFAYPPRKPLPESVVVLVNTFDRVHRMVHPLSTTINLIE